MIVDTESWLLDYIMVGPNGQRLAVLKTVKSVMSHVRVGFPCPPPRRDD